MKILTLLSLSLLLSLGASDRALAGSARPGGMRTVTLKRGPQTSRKLVGSWKLTGVERHGKAMPLPGSMSIVFELSADGTARTVMRGRAVSSKLGHWSVQKNVLLIQTRTKRTPERLRFWLQGTQLILQPSGQARTMRLHFQRVRTRPRP